MSEVAHEVAEVSAQDALDAAIERAARTQRALIMAEAQILTWKRRYVEAVRRAEALEGGGEDGETDAGGGAAAGGAADPTGSVPA